MRVKMFLRKLIHPPNLRHSTVIDSRKIQQKAEGENEKPAQSKSLDDLLTIPKSEPNKIEMDTESLKKSLEKELSLDTRDLRSHAWYHGSIPRHRAEEIVNEEGGFLVRDCTSQPGNYVLTCRTKSQVLHFVINKVIVHPDTVYEKIQFQFEDEAFDTVPDLITFYVGSEKPITVASEARIRYPKNRMYPLSHYASKYPSIYSSSRFKTPLPNPSGPRNSTSNHNLQKTLQEKELPPKMPAKQHRSHSLTPSEVNRVAQEKCSSADGVIHFPSMTRSMGNEGLIGSKFSTHSLPRSPATRLADSFNFTSLTLDRNNRNMMREISSASLSPGADQTMRVVEISEETVNCNLPPPKPSRVPSVPRGEEDGERKNGEISFMPPSDLQRVSSYHASGSDSGNGSGDSALSSVTGDPLEINQRNSGVIIKNPRYHCGFIDSSVAFFDVNFNYKELEDKLVQCPHLKLNIPSKIDLENFHSILLPVNDNKPLESQTLKGVKSILLESGSRILANHLTRCDLDIIYEKDSKNEKILYGSDIALLLLSHGHQLRNDLIERANCLKLLVAVTILTCCDDEERTEMVNKWIEVAVDTKTALGNLYGFSGVMMGLCLPQIQKLDTTWHLLRQRYTNTAFNFEAKLKPTLKNMDNCSNPQAPNTTIPHLLPMILLLEKTSESFLPSNEQNQDLPFMTTWHSNSQDFGLSILHYHLEAARKFLDLSPTFQRNAEIVLSEAKMEDLTLDMFKTEFLLKFLWGSQGARADFFERHQKFENLLDLMVERYCTKPPEE
ncbi:SH2 domain-containing protein 3C isoform X2 [Agrilus planipennis]|uniref:SH2 domain-containing protein 3C isoform X2 n=1 Tax=Agrilus planipennis TaxID=224129 RepID=A0A1W4WHY0_AGRPL|nr:SH2 domain-containing protein 3C isoform X2 [Agrilus planipennis]